MGLQMIEEGKEFIGTMGRGARSTEVADGNDFLEVIRQTVTSAIKVEEDCWSVALGRWGICHGDITYTADMDMIPRKIGNVKASISAQ
mgnify:CR=1 FL=1